MTHKNAKYNAVKDIPNVLKQLGVRRVFLCVGQNYFAALDQHCGIIRSLKDFELTRFSEFTPNPALSDARIGAAIFLAERCEATLAIGGGSCIDIAKVITALAANPEIDLGTELNSTSPLRQTYPLIVAPTTCGTGSEATPFAAYWLDGKKHSLEDHGLVPTACMLDAALLHTLPAYQIAATGFDCLCQAIESYWSTAATSESQALAERAIHLARRHLLEAFQERDPGSLYQMLLASHLAGQAIAITRTTAVHALSYPITHHLNLCHGHALAVLLPTLLRFNSDLTAETVNDKRGLDYARRTMAQLCQFFEVSTAEALAQSLEQVIRALELSTPTVTEAELERLLSDGLDPSRGGRNPKIILPADLRPLLETSLGLGSLEQ